MLSNFYNVAVYHLYVGTIFLDFAPCQSVATIHFEKTHKKNCTSGLCMDRKHGRIIIICKTLLYKAKTIDAFYFRLLSFFNSRLTKIRGSCFSITVISASCNKLLPLTYHPSLVTMLIKLQIITVLWFLLECSTLYRHIFGDLISFLSYSWAMCSALWTGGRSSNIFYNVKIKMFLSDANSTKGHHCCILNHKRIY